MCEKPTGAEVLAEVFALLADLHEAHVVNGFAARARAVEEITEALLALAQGKKWDDSR